MTDYLQDRVSKKKRFYPDENEDEIIEDSRDRFLRVGVFYYILDVFVSQFEHRFADFRRMAEKFAVMNPKHFCHPDAAGKVRALAEFYSEDLSKADDVVDEFVTFRAMYRELSMEKHELNTHSILPFLIDNDMDRAFPNLAILYRIDLTNPISSAKAERTFSCLKLIKSFLRSSMGEERLSNLALLCIERDIKIDIDKVIARFAKDKNRQMMI